MVRPPTWKEAEGQGTQGGGEKDSGPGHSGSAGLLLGPLESIIYIVLIVVLM